MKESLQTCSRVVGVSADVAEVSAILGLYISVLRDELSYHIPTESVNTRLQLDRKL